MFEDCDEVYDPSLDGYDPQDDDAHCDEFEDTLAPEEVPYLSYLGVFAPKSQRTRARRGRSALWGEGVVDGDSAISGVEYNSSDGVILSSPYGDCGFSNCVRNYNNKKDALVSEQPRTNISPSLDTPFPRWVETSWFVLSSLLVHTIYLPVCSVGCHPMYILFILSVYSSVVIYCESVYANPLGWREPWWRKLLRPLT